MNGPKRLPDLQILHQRGQQGERSLLGGKASERAERRPERFTPIRRERDAFLVQDVGEPGLGEASLLAPIDVSERLQGHGVGIAEAAIMSADGMGDRTCRAALVEDHDPGVPAAKELRRHQGEQSRLAGPCRPDHHGVADITGMKIEIKVSAVPITR